MKKLLIVISLFLLAVPHVFSQMMLQPVAAVNLIRSEMISREQLDAKIVEMQAENPNSNLQESSVLEIMINDILVLQGAERAGIVLNDSDLNTLMANQKKSVESQLGRVLTDNEFSSILMQINGMNLDEYRESLKENYIVSNYIKAAKSEMLNSIPAPIESDISAYHRLNAVSFINPEYMKLSHIFVSKSGVGSSTAKTRAESIVRELNFSGKSFNDLVIAYSEDDTSKFIGGQIGWFAIDDSVNRQVFGTNFFNEVFNLESGQVSGVIESNSGYHIVKIEDHKEARLLSLDDTLTPDNVKTVRQYISQTLYVEKQQSAYKIAVAELVKELREEAEITILLN